jgi:hypothetical protein
MLGARLEEVTALQVVDKNLWLLHDRGAVYTELIEGTFPAVKGFVARAHEMRESATRITVLSDPERAIERLVRRNPDAATYRVDVAAVDGQLTLAIPDVADDTVSAEVVGGPVSFSVNGQMFLDALKIGRMFFYAPGSPLLFQSDDGAVEHLLTLLRDEAWNAATPVRRTMTERERQETSRADGGPMTSTRLCWLKDMLRAIEQRLLEVRPTNIRTSGDAEVIEYRDQIRETWPRVVALYEKIFGVTESSRESE